MMHRQCPECGDITIDRGHLITHCLQCGWCRHATRSSFICDDCGAIDPDHVVITNDHEAHDTGVETPELKRRHDLIEMLWEFRNHPMYTPILAGLRFDDDKIETEKGRVKKAIAAKKKRASGRSTEA